MKLQTQLPLQKEDHQIDYNSRLLLLGSCFATHIGQKLDYFRFQSVQNPFGILFQPLAIEKLVVRALGKLYYTGHDVFFLNGRWHCFDAHSSLSDASKEVLLQKLNDGLDHTREQLTHSTHIIITLGTAWVYRKRDTDNLVANCHKVPQQQFTKEILSIKEIKRSLETLGKQIMKVNANAKIMLTVSPVRHLKDGFVANQQSKSHLIAAIHAVLAPNAEHGLSAYFPSYELMMDELRDYRFYDSDMVHPNQLAIAYIWEKFKHVYISEPSQDIMQKVDAVQKGLLHRPFNPESEPYKKHLASVRKKIIELQRIHPFIEFTTQD